MSVSLPGGDTPKIDLMLSNGNEALLTLCPRDGDSQLALTFKPARDLLNVLPEARGWLAALEADVQGRRS